MTITLPTVWTASDGTEYDLTKAWIDKAGDAWTCIGWLAGMGGALYSMCDEPTPLMHGDGFGFDGTPLTLVIAKHGPLTPVDESKTVVPSEFFDELTATLDEPAVPNEATRDAFRRLGGTVERRD